MTLNLNELNKQQAQAVNKTNGPLLVLAGAGSGKTKVLTYRIANILQNQLCSPWNILAITFTNKAANEMKERIAALVGNIAQGMWVLTFHSMCVRILRANAEHVGFHKNFTIYDDTDCKRLVKIICIDLHINTKIYNENAIRNKISSLKNDLISPVEFERQSHDPFSNVVADVYKEYQKRLHTSNAFDFDDLLFYTYVLFKNNPDILNIYQKRFLYISVDEYQDTNKAQYEICKMLAALNKNIMVVGDDDQSIYSWRGADINNILSFEKDFPNATTIKLEQNYRSTKNILNAANSVIANNYKRKIKNLFSTGESGEKIGVYVASNERDEGRWIASEIERKRLRKASLNDIAVFYRTNAQSRILEDMLIRAGIPYKIVGGVKFFERAEIKDVMAYLTLLVNDTDDISALRVINVPKRGIGKTSVNQISQFALQYQVSFFDACKIAINQNILRPACIKSLTTFVRCVELWKQKLNNASDDVNLRVLIENYIKDTGIIQALSMENTVEADSRIDNIYEFFGVVDEFISTHNKEELIYEAPSLSSANEEENFASDNSNTEVAPVKTLKSNSLPDLLEWVRLRTDLDNLGSVDGDKQNIQNSEAVTLMTVHSAKGLEFDYVFVAGMEENVFPHGVNFGSFDDIEEERRLAYVAITRAKKELFLSCAQVRQLYGVTNANSISRFIGEIPNELKKSYGVGSLEYSGFGWDKRGDRHGIAGSGTQNRSKSATFINFFENDDKSKIDKYKVADTNSNDRNFKVGDKVKHKVFGVGKVTKINKDRVHVTFTEKRLKKVLAKDFAPMTKI